MDNPFINEDDFPHFRQDRGNRPNITNQTLLERDRDRTQRIEYKMERKKEIEAEKNELKELAQRVQLQIRSEKAAKRLRSARNKTKKRRKKRKSHKKKKISRNI